MPRLRTALANDSGSGHGQARPDPAQHGSLALAAARPREKYIIVNVPGFHATLVENGVNRWKQKAIAGKLSTPTPQLSALATGVILNPVVGSAQEHREGSRGQEGLRSGQGRRRQDPALAPAAGADQRARPAEVRHAEFQVDLPSRHQRPQPLQRQRTRALSHGCVRTQHILDLATELLGDDGGTWTPDRIQAALDQQEDRPGELREAAAGLHRLFQLRPRSTTGGSSTTRTCTAATPRRWRRWT